MNRKRTRWILSTLGAVCIVGYMLMALRGVSPLLVRVGGVLFYFGIAIFLAVVLLWLGRRDTRRYR